MQDLGEIAGRMYASDFSETPAHTPGVFVLTVNLTPVSLLQYRGCFSGRRVMIKQRELQRRHANISCGRPR